MRKLYYKEGHVYYKVEQALLQNRVDSRYYKMGEELLQSGAGDLLQSEATLFQCGAGITKWAVQLCDTRTNGDPCLLKVSFMI